MIIHRKKILCHLKILRRFNKYCIKFKRIFNQNLNTVSNQIQAMTSKKSFDSCFFSIRKKEYSEH